MKQLVRSKNRKIAGVCQGLADYFKIDPTLVRVLFALTLIPGGIPGGLIYIVCWVIMPEA